MKSGAVIIRPAVKSDLVSVYTIAQADELRAPNHQFAERWWIRDFLQAKQPFFVAVMDKRVVGFILGECATGKVAIAHLMSVAPRYRKHGIGLLLGRAFERECRKRNMTCILLYASNHDLFFQRALTTHGYARGSLVREYQKFL